MTLATYEDRGAYGAVTFSDGKLNVMSEAMLTAIDAAFDKGAAAGKPVLLSAAGQVFTAGFNLKAFQTGTAEEIHGMLRAGAELALRILSFPLPVVALCQGHAFPMGAFLILSSDFRVSSAGDHRIGLNEVAIGLTVPRFAVETARQRLQPAYFSRTVVTGEMFTPNEAQRAGFYDVVAPVGEAESVAAAAAERLAKIDLAAHAGSKQRARAGAIETIRRVIDEDITLDYAVQRVALREAAA